MRGSTVKVSKCNHFMTASIVNKCTDVQSIFYRLLLYFVSHRGPDLLDGYENLAISWHDEVHLILKLHKQAIPALVYDLNTKKYFG